MRHLGARADVGVLRLDEAADLALRPESRPGSQVGEGPDGGAGPDLRELGLGPHDARTVTDLDVGQRRVGTDDAVAADRAGAEDLRAGAHDGVGPDRHVGVEPRRRRVDDDRAVAHGLLDGAAVELGAETGQLHLVVDTLGLPEVGDEVRAHPETAPAGDGDDVREVLLALRVVGAHLGEGFAQDRRVERVEATVDLADRALLLVGVLLLDDRDDRALRVTDDAAVARGVLERRRDDGDGTAGRVVRRDESLERGARQQRHVAVGDDDGAGEVAGQRLERALHGAPCPLDVVLVGDDRLRVDLRHVLGDAVALVAHDDGEVVRARAPGRPDRVGHETAASDRVEDLGGRGLHACALTGGEDDHGGRP